MTFGQKSSLQVSSYIYVSWGKEILTILGGRKLLEQFEIFSTIKLYNMATQKHL